MKAISSGSMRLFQKFPAAKLVSYSTGGFSHNAVKLPVGTVSRTLHAGPVAGVHAMDQPLPYKQLPFNSVEIDADASPVNDTAEFGTRLWATIAKLRESDVNAVYIKVGMLYAHYIPIAGFYGFKFHHAEGDDATMLLWLRTDKESVVPPFATHHCGVGCALTVNKGDDTKILLVKEKSKQSAWKLPGGYVNLGEDFSAAAVREVFEETGVKSQFESVLTVRHSHNIQFGRSDVYVICRMKALSEDIKIDAEIDDAQWISLREFKGFNKHPMLDRVAELLIKDTPGLKEDNMESTIPGRLPFKLYSPK